MSARLPSLEEMLNALLATPSVSSMVPEFDQGNQAVAGLLAGWLESAGFAVELQPLPQAGKCNLVASLGSGPGGLVLAGHTDTVPYDEHRWNHDPFAATFTEDRVYGLGACDMKSFFAILLEAWAAIRARNLRAPLYVIATADEESSMSGARALAEAGRVEAAHALIGEPTGLKPVRTHKGIMMEEVRITGQSGHSSDPSLGANAIEGAARVIDALRAWRAELQERHQDATFHVPVPTLNLGHIHGGDNPNRICGACTLQLDIRPLPGMALDELRAELDARAQAALRDSGLTAACRPLFAGAPPLATPADAPVVRAAEACTGHPAGAVAFATEGPWLERLGCATVILGPGDIEQAHQPDEYLALERIAPMQSILTGMIHRFCIDPETDDA